jgi:4-amino-4-deoxy-L-arabinose transferase-like glycosyltransferase
MKSVEAQVKTGVSTSVSIIRWICVIPVACVAFYPALFVAMFSFKLLNTLCIGSTITSGLCNNGWVIPVSFIIGASLAPALVILSGTMMAPSNRPAVAWAIYLVGALVSFKYFGRLQHALIPAGISGALVAAFLARKYRKAEAHNHWVERPAAR